MGLFNWGQKSECSECCKLEEAQKKTKESINFSKTLVGQIQELETEKMNITNEKIKSMETKLEEEVRKNAKLIVANDNLKEENNKLSTNIEEVRYTNEGLKAEVKRLEGIKELQKSAEEIKSIVEERDKFKQDLENEIRKNARLIVEMENNNKKTEQNNIEKEIALKISEDKEKMNKLLEEKIKDFESLNTKLAEMRNELTEEKAKRLTFEVDSVQKDEQITYLSAIIQDLTRSRSVPRMHRQFELKPGLFVGTKY